MKISLADIKSRKGGQKLVSLTAYTFPMAKILDEFCDIILVGDSLGMTIYGLNDTVDVTLEMMINHAKAVTRAAKKAFIVVDLPFGTYESSKELALASAQKVLAETGCDAVKIETPYNLAETVQYLVQNNVNVMAHIGLMPQHVRQIGGYKYQGKEDAAAQEILKTAHAIEKAGAFSVVIEAVPALLATEITNSLTIPTIGIGASEKCDGQILVIDDLLGLNQEFKPRFVKHYAQTAQDIKSAVAQYQQEVRQEKFPTKANMV